MIDDKPVKMGKKTTIQKMIRPADKKIKCAFDLTFEIKEVIGIVASKLHKKKYEIVQTALELYLEKELEEHRKSNQS